MLRIHGKLVGFFVAVVCCAFVADVSPAKKDKDSTDAKEERVEIKYLVPESQIEAICKRLNLDVHNPTETRVVCFYDTESQELFNHQPKVILRSRDSTDGKTDTTVKIRGKRTEDKKVKCESDSVIGKPEPVLSCSLTDETQDRLEIETANKGRDVKKIFNHDQENFVTNAGIEHLKWGDLMPFGPVNDVKVWKHLSAEGLEAITVERWELPERDTKPKRVLFEVSTKTPMSALPEVTAAFKKLLGIEEVDAQQESETKTKLVMDHFAKSSNH